ncbi:MAG: hypothetical protein A3F16_04495 [Deltaproteobacteria bacterium RIFCSPHIGHO2_12_FULL_43_9]|nr:MAG: hypothetical protein A3F16_04495 [Deltaproteobacteria bacterium RIFCSPHIGHO2_12_FULL_43_9]
MNALNRKYCALLVALFLLVVAMPNVFGEQIDDDTKAVNDIVTDYWQRSDLRERAESLLNIPVLAIDDDGNLEPRLSQLFKITYCYYIEEISKMEGIKALHNAPHALCPIVNRNPNLSDEDLIASFKKMFREEILRLTNNFYNGEIGLVIRQMPLPKQELGDKSLRLINMHNLLSDEPFTVKTENGIATISVRHLLNKDRRSIWESNITREMKRFQFEIKSDDVKNIVLDLKGVKAADLSSVMYIVAQLIRKVDTQSVDLVEYKPYVDSSIANDVRYVALFHGDEFRLVASKKLGGRSSFEQTLSLRPELRALSRVPLKILVDNETSGYVELIPQLLTAVGKGVTVTGETSGAITAELSMDGGVVNVLGHELFFSAGELLVTNGKTLRPYKFQKFEGVRGAKK